MTHHTAIPPIAAPTDALLFAFRRVATIEHRLLSLEDWVASGHRDWTVVVLRLMRLRQINPKIAPYYETCHPYLLAVHERGRP